MKKFKSILVLALVALFVTACSADSLIGKFEKAAKDGDTKKAAKIAKKLDKKGALTDDQKKKVAEAYFELADKASKEDWKAFQKETEEVDLTK